MSHNVLIVDDDPILGEMLEKYLTNNGYIPFVAGDGPIMNRILSETKIDIVLLDLGLPGKNGLELLRQLRAVSNIPIIVVTGKGDEVDRIVGLEIGADDYIVKPFSTRELLARIRSVLRRAESANEQIVGVVKNADAGKVAEFGEWRLNMDSRQLQSGSTNVTHLTTAEFNLLRSFLNNPKRVLSRDQLLDMVYGQNHFAADRIIDTLVMRLRRKIEATRNSPTLITTVRNAGYMYSGDIRWTLI